VGTGRFAAGGAALAALELTPFSLSNRQHARAIFPEQPGIFFRPSLWPIPIWKRSRKQLLLRVLRLAREIGGVDTANFFQPS